MTRKPKENVVDFKKVANKLWTCEENGLKKELLEFNFSELTKPTEISKCLVKFTEISNIGSRKSIFLLENAINWIKLGTAVTPIDYYIELFLQQMIVGEKSMCSISTKSKERLSFTTELLQVEENKYMFQLTPNEMYELALSYKTNGVAMFKTYQKFANEYFNRAAKCLISLKPFVAVDDGTDGSASPEAMQELLENLQINIAACLINEERFEDVAFLTKFIETKIENVSEKGIYRRALAFYHLKKYSEAKDLIERVADFRANKGFLALHNKILADWKIDTNRYNSMVKKMFGNVEKK